MVGMTRPAEEPQAEGNVSPEEQGQYDQFVKNAYALIYDPKMLPEGKPGSEHAIVKRIAAGGNPVEGLANATVMIVARLSESAKENGTQISPDVLFHGGMEIMEDLANLAMVTGVHTFSEKELEQASYVAMDMYRSIKGNEIDPNVIGQDLEMLKQASDAGKLDELAPGLSTMGTEQGEGEPAEDEGEPPEESEEGEPVEPEEDDEEEPVKKPRRGMRL